MIIFGDVCSSSYNLVLVAFCLSALASVKHTVKGRRGREGKGRGTKKIREA